MPHCYAEPLHAVNATGGNKVPPVALSVSMQWTDRIRQVKIVLVVAAVAIAVASLAVSDALVRDLAQEERGRMEVWAEAMRSLNTADETTDLNLVLTVINENNTIPVVVMDSEGNVQTHRNVVKATAAEAVDGGAMAPDVSADVSAEQAAKDAERVTRAGRRMLAAGRYIRISLDDEDYIDVCYDESLLLRRLSVYPYIQLGVVLLFVVVAIFALLTSKKAEQNKVWVGLSKETAHQLGTPVSSLMAWIEMFKESYPDDTLVGEMESDVRRLQLIAERFSKIGSVPEPVPTNLRDVVTHVADYMDRRTSHKVTIVRRLPDDDITLPLNAPLFEWVIENLCKNAVDAMDGDGTITIAASRDGQRIKGRHMVTIDVSDTGKGIRKKDLGNVFKPGFTTKQRGWGLGLSLAKRIVEEYHHGRIFVKSSEPGRGTTFRITLTEI